MSWEYKREEQQFKALPEGKYRIRVKSVEKQVSKNSGNDMLAFQFEVSGSKSILYHYISFLKDRPEITNRMLTAFFDSFAGIPDGDFNLNNWVGKVGACMVKHDDEDRAKISYFIKSGKYDDLPAWVEPEGSSTVSNAGVPTGQFVDVSAIDEELPFI